MKRILLSCLTLITITTQSLATELIHIPFYMTPWHKLDNEKVLLPHLTFPMLEKLQSWNVSNWKVFEWGLGNSSTPWFGIHCKKYIGTMATGDGNTDVVYDDGKTTFKLRSTSIVERRRGFNAGGEKSKYVQAIEEDNSIYDCIIINGFHRDACAELALKHVKPGSIIILNNANQGSLGINSSKIFNLYNKFSKTVLKQPNHRDWATAYWIVK